MPSKGLFKRRQDVVQLLLNRRKARILVACFFLGGVVITILRCYGFPLAELSRGTSEFSVWWNRLEPSAFVNDSKNHEEVAVDNNENPSPLIAWMQSSGITPDRIPLISIADSKYIQALRNIKSRLDKWDRGSDLVVICLEIACTREDSFKGYGGYISQDGKVMYNVALIKVSSNYLSFLQV